MSSDSEFESDTDEPTVNASRPEEVGETQTFLGPTSNKINEPLLNTNIGILTIPQKQIQEDSNPSSSSNNQDLPSSDSYVETNEEANKGEDEKKDSKEFQSSEI